MIKATIQSSPYCKEKVEALIIRCAQLKYATISEARR